MRKTHGRLILKSQQKVVKNRRFLSKTAVFVAKHYNLDISNFRFAILKYCPTALLGRAAFAAFERFAKGKTSAQGEFTSPEQFKEPQVSKKEAHSKVLRRNGLQNSPFLVLAFL